MEINTSFPKAQRFDNHPDVLGFEDLGIHCWYVEVKNDELGVVKESFKGKGQILTRYWELYLQDRKYTAASSPLPHKVGEEEFCDRGKSHAQTHDHRKTVSCICTKKKPQMILPVTVRVEQHVDPLSTCFISCCFGPYLSAITVFTLHKQTTPSEFNLNRLNTAGVKTPLTLYCMNYDNLRQEC